MASIQQIERLFTAASKGDIATLHEILQVVDVNTKFSDEEVTPLHLAALHGQVEVARLLFEKKANIEACTKTRRTPLHVSALNGQSAMVDFLLQHNADMTAKDSDGATPLHLAAQQENPEVLEILLKRGSNIEDKSKAGNTPLHNACFKGCAPVVQILLANNANVNATNANVVTPLHCAAYRSHPHIAQILLQAGGEIESINKFGNTPLHSAAIQGAFEVAQVFIQNGSAVNAINNEGESPLHKAAEKGHANIVDLLAQHKADLNARNLEGKAALHIAAMSGHKAVVEVLVQHGANIKAKDNNGNTPLFLAVANKQDEIATFLEQNGAPSEQDGELSDEEDKDENTIYDLFANEPEIIKEARKANQAQFRKDCSLSWNRGEKLRCPFTGTKAGVEATHVVPLSLVYGNDNWSGISPAEAWRADNSIPASSNWQLMDSKHMFRLQFDRNTGKIIVQPGSRLQSDPSHQAAVVQRRGLIAFQAPPDGELFSWDKLERNINVHNEWVQKEREKRRIQAGESRENKRQRMAN